MQNTMDIFEAVRQLATGITAYVHAQDERIDQLITDNKALTNQIARLTCEPIPGPLPRKTLDVIDDLEVGQTWFLAGDDPTKTMRALCNAATQRHKTTTKRFTVRSITGGAKIWRIQ